MTTASADTTTTNTEPLKTQSEGESSDRIKALITRPYADALDSQGELNLQTEMKVGLLWARGFNPYEISEALDISIREAGEIVKKQRAEIALWHKDEIEALKAERISGIREVRKKAWSEYNDPKAKSGSRMQSLALALRTEESEAKISGVMEINLNLHLKSREKDAPPPKTFDINNPYPEPEIVEGEVVEVTDSGDNNS